MLDEGTSLINQLSDRLRQLNNLAEEYGNLLNGHEENVINLVREVKELWEKLEEIPNKQSAAFRYCYSCSEEQRQEYRKQDETVSNLKDDVFATLFNAKYLIILYKFKKNENNNFLDILLLLLLQGIGNVNLRKKLSTSLFLNVLKSESLVLMTTPIKCFTSSWVQTKAYVIVKMK